MFLCSLKRRDRRPERMDEPTLEPGEHRRALAGLARINRVSGSAGVLWPSIRGLAAEIAPRPLRVLDLATGSGDVPLGLWTRARSAGIALELAGCDLSPVAVATAIEQARKQGAPVHFFVHNVLQQTLPDDYDVLTCSLFLHHLEEADLVRLLAAMGKAARRAVVVNDLARSRINFLMVSVASLLLTRSRVVHEDGPLSVRAALTLKELAAHAASAGLADAAVARRFPCRLLLEWRKPA